jgi:hypothetical protein
MFAITVGEISGQTGRRVWLTLNGKLIGASVGEFERIWNQVKEESGTGIGVNLSAVTCILPSAKHSFSEWTRKGLY